MVARLRLQRVGRRHLPVFQLVAADAKAARDGKFLEKLGTYSPIPDRNGLKHISINVKAVQKWIMRGAQMSEPVMWLLSRARITPPAPIRGSTNVSQGVTQADAPGPPKE
uniref:30S ribosomal protein S16 n=1 Tax=Coccolithus braarudii TaxID=221442 RepID=A0A7S0PYV1_9EUKA